MKGVERINTVMTNPQQRVEFPQRNPYAMDMDKNNWNCYAYGGFRHLARNCRNRITGINRRIEVKQDNNNLKEEQNLIVFN